MITTKPPIETAAASRAALDAACANFGRALSAYKRGDLQRLQVERAWARFATRRAK